MGNVHRIAGLRITRAVPSGGSIGHASLPELEPPENRLQKARSHIFSADAISLSRLPAMDDAFEAHQRLEPSDIVARLTVYVINLIVIVLALPIGIALLCLNIVGGENLRTSAHVLALTGMYMGLASAPENDQLISLFWNAWT